ncbi:Large subunit GTPase 1 [Hypsizygus marmoreus]|uniref:Large subunit GTPase 1 n=1 Tax=Hypsizygus marmoreus TaxID=39966 RepID=A0A369K2M5_HYPMA|nr:Large subunit GTPase 1 [Hypsizygus marmoreus]
MTPKPRDPNPSGLGRAIINRKVKDARKQQESGLYVSDLDAINRLKSITQERDLDEFLNTAQLAGTEFTAERRNVKIIQQSASVSQNPYLLSEQEERNTLKKHSENKQRLRVPRRPPWTKSMTTSQLDKQEKTAFLDWRRGLAQLQEEENFLLTPFERNIEVWRQLWRVLERSHLIVQIVDARNPLRFRCEDLEAYVQDVEGAEGEAGTGKGKRRSLLLINKADLLTSKQRCLWADYFDSQGIKYAFFSAANAAALQQARRDAILLAQTEPENNEGGSDEGNDKEQHDSGSDSDESGSEDDSDDGSNDEDSLRDEAYFSAEEEDTSPEGQDARAKVLSVLELEDWFERMAPDLSSFTDQSGQPPSRLVVGLVGYPNVGKSSTINSLLGEKKVSVSSTPGKTKHFQTIHLSDKIVLCDCPGLVFPQFATTKADLVCDGVLPIDQLREHTGPVSLVVKRIPKDVLEATYGLTIKVSGIEEGGDGKITAENFLISYAVARGYTRSGQGNPDEARSARHVLKDYVNGKLLFCHPPPGTSDASFNEESHESALLRAAGKKRAPVTRVGKGADTFVPSNIPQPIEGSSILPAQGQGLKSQALDHAFFENNSNLSSRPFIQSSLRHGEEYSRATMYPHQNAVANDGTPLGRRRIVGKPGEGKKHHKKMTRVKQRSGKGYD